MGSDTSDTFTVKSGSDITHETKSSANYHLVRGYPRLVLELSGTSWQFREASEASCYVSHLSSTPPNQVATPSFNCHLKQTINTSKCLPQLGYTHSQPSWLSFNVTFTTN